MRFARPQSIAPAETVFLFAPSSPFEQTRFEAGRALLAARYRVEEASGLFEREGFLAGSDELRARDLTGAIERRHTRALIAARGGYGATRLLDRLPLEQIRTEPRWLVGFSDVSALHALWARAGICSIHGPMVCSLPEGSEQNRQEWFALLEGRPPSPLGALERVRGGRARGTLFATNLTVLGALVGTPYFPPLDGAVLALEDIGERPYRIDRTLTQLLATGALAQVAAIVLGQFTQCDPGPDGTTAADVLAERLSRLGVPIVAAAPFGHVAENRPLLNGCLAEVDADRGTVHFEASA